LFIVKAYLGWKKEPNKTEEDKALENRISNLERSRFSQWAKLVREPLVWLGMPDPELSVKYVKENDTQADLMDDIKEAWEHYLGKNERTLNQALTPPKDPDLLEAYEAFKKVCEAIPNNGLALARRLADFIHANNSRGESAFFFKKLPRKGHGVIYTLIKK
jgi:hypothetical protein